VFSVKQDSTDVITDLVGLREEIFVKTHSGFPTVENPRVRVSLLITSPPTTHNIKPGDATGRKRTQRM